MMTNRPFTGACLLACIFTLGCPHRPAASYATLQQALEDCKVQPCSDDKRGDLENRLGSLYLAHKDAKNAEPYLRNTVAYTKRKFGPGDIRTAISIDNLATALTQQGKVDESIPLHQEACSFFERQVGPTGTDLGICLTGLGHAFAVKGDRQLAVESYKKAFLIFSPRLDNSPEMDALLTLMGDLDTRSDRLQVAFPHKRWFVSVSEFPELMILVNDTIKDTRFILGAHDPSGMAVSVRLNQLPAGSARACRESSKDATDRLKNGQEAKISDTDEFSELEFEYLSDYKDRDGTKKVENHHDIVRYYFHDGICITVHLFKWNYTPANRPIFERILNTVTILDFDKFT